VARASALPAQIPTDGHANIAQRTRSRWKLMFSVVTDSERIAVNEMIPFGG